MEDLIALEAKAKTWDESTLIAEYDKLDERRADEGVYRSFTRDPLMKHMLSMLKVLEKVADLNGFKL